MSAESNRIEYKSVLNDKLEREVVAFLNYHAGGVIYIGMNDSGEVLGVTNADRLQCEIGERIKNNILPNVLGLFDVVLEHHGELDVIKIIVASGQDRPYYIKQYGMSPKGCYLRVGSTAQPMTTGMINAQFARRARVTLSTMHSPRHHLTFEQLMIYYLAKGRKLNDHFKRNLELVRKDGDYNYLAYLLADENGVSIKVAKYAGKNKVHLIENYEFGYCSIVKAAKSVLDKMEIENVIFTEITSTTRKERQRVNMIALRETIINAIVHNDYSLEVPPVVEIFSDRITVTSYGGLLPEMSQEDFFSGRSMPRNRELMRVFKDLELVEQLGSGMERIMDVYDRSIFEFHDNFMVTTLMCEPYADDANGTDDPINGTDEPINGTDDPINGTDEPINGTDEPANGTDEQIVLAVIEAIALNQKITIAELIPIIGKSRRTVLRIIKKLQDYGMLRRIGTTRSGHWEIY